MSEFGQIAAQQVTGSVRAAASEPPPHPAFREFMTLHGHTDQRFTVLPESVEVLAHAVVAESPYDAAPTAIRIEIADGSLYILPHHTAGNIQVLLERLTEAVLEHREGALAALPPFFDELLLPGEENVVREIEGTQAALERLEGERAALTRQKLLVGHSSGGQLERLVIE
ncbi:MAG: hypothetical protein M3O70_13595 [Actinomycetota bacterium]|nr:hypothetical protein [Actinomycetota bacterium]